MTRQINLALVALFTAFSFSAFSQSTRTPGSFEGVSVSGSYNVILVKGSSEKVEITPLRGTEIEDIITKVEGRTLKIKTKKYVRNAYADIVVTFKEIETIHSSGSSSIVMKDPLKGSRMEIHCSGSGEIEALAEGRDLSVHISGSAKVEVSGNSESVEFHSSGSGDLYAFDLVSEEAEVSISGSSNARLNVSKALRVSISGSGDVRYKGKPDMEKISISGSGTVRKEM